MIPPGWLDRPADHSTEHVLGPADAEITLVEYGSYACPQCRAANERIARQAFPGATDFSAAKIAVFAASILSAAVGTALLWGASRQELFEEASQSVGTQVSKPAGVTPDREQEVVR